MTSAFEIVWSFVTYLVYERINTMFSASLLDDGVLKFHQNCFALLFCPQLRRSVEMMPQFQALSFHERYQVWIKLATFVEENAYHFSGQWQVFHQQAIAFKEMSNKQVFWVDAQDYELHHPFN